MWRIDEKYLNYYKFLLETGKSASQQVGSKWMNDEYDQDMFPNSYNSIQRDGIRGFQGLSPLTSDRLIIQEMVPTYLTKVGTISPKWICRTGPVLLVDSLWTARWHQLSCCPVRWFWLRMRRRLYLHFVAAPVAPNVEKQGGSITAYIINSKYLSVVPKIRSSEARSVKCATYCHIETRDFCVSKNIQITNHVFQRSRRSWENRIAHQTLYHHVLNCMKNLRNWSWHRVPRSTKSSNRWKTQRFSPIVLTSCHFSLPAFFSAAHSASCQYVIIRLFDESWVNESIVLCLFDLKSWISTSLKTQIYTPFIAGFSEPSSTLVIPML